ncbi:MAG: alpha/beta hydrolase [Aeromicrobium sp.]|uniref:alpha/beta hydrolase n=1 Tax=Aeromicrobium sp. TaxID=1871063 RepID=UPI0039E6896C
MGGQDVLLIHGTWGNGSGWDEVAHQLTAQGYTVHAPTLPHHGRASEIDVEAEAREVAKLGLSENVDFLRGLVDAMDTTPIVIGHSLGGLYAQLLAAQVETAGVVLIGPAPPAGVFAHYPTTSALWLRYSFDWIARRPMYPVSREVWNRYVCNTTPREISDALHRDLCPESGTVYWQLGMWFLDPGRHAKVDFDAITSPVLVIAGGKDRCCTPTMVRSIARRYGARATYVEIAGADHMMITGSALPHTLRRLGRWIDENDRRAANPRVAVPARGGRGGCRR